MKKILLILFLILALQANLWAAPGVLDSSTTLDTVLISTFLAFAVEHLVVAWGLDKYMVAQGNESNYWGTFWGSTIFSFEMLPMIRSFNLERRPYSPEFVGLYLGCQLFGGYFGNLYLGK